MPGSIPRLKACMATQPPATCYQTETQLERYMPRKDPLRNPLSVVKQKNQEAILHLNFITPHGELLMMYWGLTCSAGLLRLLHLHLSNKQHQGRIFNLSTSDIKLSVCGLKHGIWGQ